MGKSPEWLVRHGQHMATAHHHAPTYRLLPIGHTPAPPSRHEVVRVERLDDATDFAAVAGERAGTLCN